MRLLLFLVLVVSLWMNAAAAQTMDHACCPDQACATHCIDMGCAPAACPIAPPTDGMPVPAADPVRERALEAASLLPWTVTEIWIPPD